MKTRLLTVVFLFVSAAAWMQAEDKVLVKESHPLGIPLHEDAGKRAVSRRLPAPDPVEVQILKTAKDGTWYLIKHDSVEGWISSRYAVKAPDPQPLAPAAINETITVGSWNLEHFKEGAARGFPEIKLSARKKEDYQLLANTIVESKFQVLVLEEVNGEETAEGIQESPELEMLISMMPATDKYAYIVGSTGRSQRVAILYNTATVQLGTYSEMACKNDQIDGKNTFDRQPLVAYFKVLQDGKPKNDFVVVGVHLASLQNLTHNHDVAMSRILAELDSMKATNQIPKDERDFFIMGDFNASRYDKYKENFWVDVEAKGWKVLAPVADAGSSYPGTRVNGSQIDYIIATNGPGGLVGEELQATTATVNTNLVTRIGGPEQFRIRLSDHIPVTVNLSITKDND